MPCFGVQGHWGSRVSGSPRITRRRTNRCHNQMTVPYIKIGYLHCTTCLWLPFFRIFLISRKYQLYSIFIQESKMQIQQQEDTPMADAAQAQQIRNPNPSPLENPALKQSMFYRVNSIFSKPSSSQAPPKPSQTEEEKKEPGKPANGLAQNIAGTSSNKALQPAMTFGLARALHHPRNPTLANTFKLQKQQPLPQKQVDSYQLPVTKKRTLIDLESELSYMRPPSPLELDEEIFQPTQLPSPVFKPDFIILDKEQQKLVEKAEVEAKKVEVAKAAMSESPAPLKELYIPTIEEEEGPQLASRQICEDDAEVIIKRENELIELREQLKSKEEAEALLQYGFKELKAKIDSIKSESKRVDMLKLVQQGDTALKTSFFELQPNLIYARDPKGLPLPSKLQLTPDFTTGILTDLDLAFAFHQRHLYLWRLSSPDASLQTTPFTSDLLSVSAQTLPSKKTFILIFTTEELHAYEIKGAPQNGFKLERFDIQSSDRIRYGCLLKTQKKGRLFIGGEKGQVSELIIEAGGVKGGFAKKMINKARNLIMGTNGSKLKKVDKSIEKASGFFQKLIGGFLNTEVDRVVIDMAEDPEKNLLFAASDSSVEIYDMGEEFRSLMKIEMDGIVGMIEQRVKAKLSYDAERFQIVKISANGQGQLAIVLSNGSLITLQITLNPAPKSKSKADVSFTPISLQLLDVVSVNFGHILTTYEDLFDDFIPDESLVPTEDINLWKPITQKPINFSTMADPFIQQTQCLLRQAEVIGDKIFYLVQDIKSPQSFLVTLEPNYRRGKPYQYTQYLTSVKGIADVGLSLTVVKESKAQVITDKRVYEFCFPTGKDLTYQYLQLLVQNDQKQQAQIYERIKADFHVHLQAQDLLTTLEHLFDIVLSRRATDKILMHQFSQAFYVNQARFLSQNHQQSSQFIRPQFDYKQALTHLIQFVSQHHSTTGCLDIPVTPEIQSLALDYFITLSTHSIDFDSNLLPDAHFNTTYPAFSRNAQIDFKEKLRLDVVYKQLARICETQLKTKLFKVNKEQGLERDASMFIIGGMQEKVAKIENILERERIRMQKVAGEGGERYREEFQAVMKLLARVKEGLSIIIELESITQKKDVLKDVPKETRDALPKLTVEDFINQGTSNNEVCILLELYFSQFDPYNLDKNGSNNLREVTKNFISHQAYSLLLGRRYLQYAFIHKPDQKQIQSIENVQKLDKYKQLGFNHLRRYSESVNLPIAMEELLKNIMPVQALSLCLEAIDNIEAMRKIDAAPAKQYQMQQNVAIDIVMILLQEVYKRMEQEGAKKVETKEGDLSFQTIFREQLSTVQRENLIGLKRKMVQMCIKCTSELFHLSLYELLIKQKGGLQELKNLKTVFMPRYLDRLNISLDESRQGSGEKKKEQQKPTQQQQISLFKSKLEASYNHHVSQKLYADAFQYLITQLCVTQDTQLDIKDRIHWLQKAEGCLDNHLNTPGHYLTIQQQKYVTILKKFKDYLHLVLKLCENKKLDEKEREIIDKSLVNPEDLCEIAMRVKEYKLCLQVIEVNEVKRYQIEEGFSGYLDRVSEGTQGRIDRMYRQMIENSKAFAPDSKDKKVVKLQDRLKQLYLHSQYFDNHKPESIQGLTYFPRSLIISLLHKQSLQLLKSLKQQDLPMQKAFWYLDFILSYLKVDANTLCSIAAPPQHIESLLHSQHEPEDYFAVAYLALKVQPVIGSLLNVKALEAQQILTKVLEDELQYSQSFVATVRELTPRVNKTDLVGKVRDYIHNAMTNGAQMISPQQ